MRQVLIEARIVEANDKFSRTLGVRLGYNNFAGDGVFGSGEDAAAVFRIEPAKVLAFAKEPHAQTTYRFTGR